MSHEPRQDSHVSTPPDDSSEPSWLSDASAPGGAGLLGTSGSSISSALYPSSPAVVRLPSAAVSEGEEPAWLAHAASRADIDLEGGGDSPSQQHLGFRRAVQASHAAVDEFRSLSASEIADGLLALSMSCAKAMKRHAYIGAREVTNSTSAVFTAATAAAPADGAPRWRVVLHGVREQDWRGALQLPYAAGLAMLAFFHAVLAILVTFAVHTPRAARELREYATDAAQHYGVGRYSATGQIAAQQLHALMNTVGDGSRRPPPPQVDELPCEGRPTTEASAPATSTTGDESV